MRKLQSVAATEAGRLLRVLLLWFGEVSDDSGATRMLFIKDPFVERSFRYGCFLTRSGDMIARVTRLLF